MSLGHGVKVTYLKKIKPYTPARKQLKSELVLDIYFDLKLTKMNKQLFLNSLPDSSFGILINLNGGFPDNLSEQKFHMR